HAGRLVMIPARDHDPPPADDGAAGRAELGRELRRHLDVGEAGDTVAAEERAAPALPPDQTHGEGGAVLDPLVGPDLDRGLDHAPLADPAEVGDDDAFRQEGVGADHGLLPDDGFLHHGPGTDLDAVPYHAAFDVRARLDDRVRPDHRVGHSSARRDQGAPAHDHRSRQTRRIVDASPRVEPYRVAVARVALSGYVDADPALKQIEVSRAVFGEVAHVTPVSLRHVTPERPARGEEGREELLAEVIWAPCR